jgi:DNA integrity scanning protein DisA with diadenylate cyclase activity
MTIAALRTLCSRIPWCEPAVLESALELALEIAREGREGRRIGTLFTVGKADAVLAASRELILDPLAGHAPARTHITDPNLRGTIKELAQLDTPHAAQRRPCGGRRSATSRSGHAFAERSG